ncbi:MAG: phosphonoacetaldehyde reductase, partial [Elusimicrobia bacterium]|nr:phosphonoacetaldehyde reductase [Elusimicrobiota bacterium]
MKDKVIIGKNNLDSLKEIVSSFQAKRIFLVTGKSSYTASGIKQKVDKLLSGIEVKRHSDFTANPKFSDIKKILSEFRDFNPDMLIAIGGGSVIDTAKLLSVFPDDEETCFKIIKGELPVPVRTLPFVAVPTTAGSGSEATKFAVVYDNFTKYSVSSDNVLPDIVILDATLTQSLTKKQRLISAFDAFSQAVESYWALRSTEESRAYSKESIELIISIYDRLIDQPSIEDLEKMLYASFLAGKAINISTTTAPHAASYTLTSKHNIPHGYAVILTLPYFLILNATAGKDDLNSGIEYAEYSEIIRELLDILKAESAEDAANEISDMVR